MMPKADLVIFSGMAIISIRDIPAALLSRWHPLMPVFFFIFYCLERPPCYFSAQGEYYSPESSTYKSVLTSKQLSC